MYDVTHVEELLQASGECFLKESVVMNPRNQTGGTDIYGLKDNTSWIYHI